MYKPFKTGETLQAIHEVKIYDGLLLAEGVMEIRFGYLLQDGTVTQDEKVITLTVMR